MLFSSKNTSEDFYKSKYEGLEEDKVLKKWFEDNLRMKGGFYYIELDGKVYSLIFIDYINARNIVAISSLIPKITKNLISKEQRAAKLEFLPMGTEVFFMEVATMIIIGFVLDLIVAFAKYVKLEKEVIEFNK